MITGLTMGAISDTTSCWHIIKHEVEYVAHGIATGTQKVIKAAADVFNDTNAMCNGLRLTGYIVMFYEHMSGRVGVLSQLMTHTEKTYSFIDTILICDPIDYFVNNKEKDDSAFAKGGNAAYLAAGVGGLFFFLDELNFINLTTITEKLSSLPIFGMVTILSLGKVSLGLVGIGYALFGLDAIKRIINSEKIFICRETVK